MFKPRPYQQDAVNAVIKHVKKNLSTCLVSAATGSGKTIIIAELARFFSDAAPKKRVLCIAPSKELIEQGAEKYRAYGYPASIFCASAGFKCLRSQVIFASPQTAIKQIDRIARLGVSAIIIDECHGVSNTIIELINKIKNYEENKIKPNEKVRIIGLTATPYRLGSGYVYAIDDTVDPVIHHDESKAINPYFSHMVYEISAGSLLSDGYLTKPVIGATIESYDTSKLETDKFGQFSSKSVSIAFEGNTKTERIVNQIIATANEFDRRGVMIFAATISHAEEITKFLPGGEFALVTGKTNKKERENIISEFKKKNIRYLVNVAVLCTGFDSSHVDYIAILRATESASLLQQIIGRSLRLDPDKEYALIHDYAENIKRHGLESDIFTPDIKTRKAAGDGVEIEVQCPSCGCISMKKRRNDPTYDGLAHNRYGEFLISGTEKAIRFDDENNPIEWEGEPLTMQILDPSNKDEFGQIGFKEITVPAHYSRRCANPEAFVIKGVAQPCVHRYAFKVCPHCFEENDIAARHCVKCKERLVDPNEKLTEKAGFAVIMAEGETKLVNCAGAEYALHVSAGGNKTIKATFKTELGSVTDWCTPKKHWIFNRIVRANGRIPEFFNDLKDCEQFKIAPKTVRIKKHTKDGFTRFEVKEVNF